MSTKINFTLEHRSKLDTLLLKFLYGALVIKGNLGIEQSAHDLLHTTTINTLQQYHRNISKEIENKKGLDEWSLTTYQQSKLAELEETKELLNLLIGYRKHKEQVASEAAKIKALKAQYKELEKSTLTPEQQLAELKKQITELGGELDGPPEAPSTESAPERV